jgi:tRNA dimethylallyltransferase
VTRPPPARIDVADTADEVIAIVGPTGAGKSAMAMRRAAADPRIEIVAIDAFTLYRGMDIATAKPSRADRARVRHHLVDILDPDTEADVAWFQGRARAAVADIRRRGGVPLLVGGSGLYFRAVVDDLTFPPTDPELRAEIERRWRDDPRGGHARLTSLDPDAAARIEPGNLRRTVRALEVIALTGSAFSSFSHAWDDHSSIYPGLAVTYVEPPREQLRERLARRAAGMVADGLVAEGERLRRRYPRGLSPTARKAIGYAEAFDVIDGRLSEDTLAEAITRRSVRYARRQRSWFRRDPRCTVAVPPSAYAER